MDKKQIESLLEEYDRLDETGENETRMLEIKSLVSPADVLAVGRPVFILKDKRDQLTGLELADLELLVSQLEKDRKAD